MDARTAPEKPAGEHLRVVQNKCVAWLKVTG